MWTTGFKGKYFPNRGENVCHELEFAQLCTIDLSAEDVLYYLRQFPSSSNVIMVLEHTPNRSEFSVRYDVVKVFAGRLCGFQIDTGTWDHVAPFMYWAYVFPGFEPRRLPLEVPRFGNREYEIYPYIYMALSPSYSEGIGPNECSGCYFYVSCMSATLKEVLI